MKLIIRRNQADVKGVFGGHKGVRFSLYAKADITSEERALIDRYKVGDYSLASYEKPLRGSPEKKLEFHLSVNNLIDGRTTELDSISTLLDLEEEIKKGCQSLKNLLLVMSTFGGEEVIEI
jgi:hypothetical protein